MKLVSVGTNIYFPQAWLAAACLCCGVVIAEISYLIIMHQVLLPYVGSCRAAAQMLTRPV